MSTPLAEIFHDSFIYAHYIEQRENRIKNNGIGTIRRTCTCPAAVAACDLRGIDMETYLKEVSTLRELRQFVSFQYTLYKDNKFWVPPLRSEELFSLRKEKNPAFDFCEAKYWLAIRNNKIIGRIAGIINGKYNEKWGVKTVRFGWFDFLDDREAAAALLDAVENGGNRRA